MGQENNQTLHTISPEELLEAEEAARLLRVSRSTVYDLAKSRKISHLRIGMGRGRLFFTRQAILDYLETCKVERDSLPPTARFTHRRWPSP